jgi:hypothetical protein
VLLAALAMFFKYNLELGARTVKLEQKNGKELKEIAELRKELADMKMSQVKDRQNKENHHDQN